MRTKHSKHNRRNGRNRGDYKDKNNEKGLAKRLKERTINFSERMKKKRI